MSWHRMGDVVVVVQCKLYFANAIGNKAVQEAHAAAGFFDASHAVVASNAQYTRSAEQLAAKLGVLLLHHSELPDLERLLTFRRRQRCRPAPLRLGIFNGSTEPALLPKVPPHAGVEEWWRMSRR